MSDRRARFTIFLGWVSLLAGCSAEQCATTRAGTGAATPLYTLIRIENADGNGCFYAIGPTGNFTYECGPEIPPDLARADVPAGGAASPAMAPASSASTGSSASPALAPTTAPVSGMPRVVLKTGWVYLAGKEVVATTGTVAAGATGCHMLLVKKNSEIDIFFEKGPKESTITGQVKSLVGLGTLDTGTIGDMNFVSLTPDPASPTGALLATNPVGYTPGLVPELVSGKIELGKRVNNPP